MIDHQFSKLFKANTDLNFKNEEFENSLSEFMTGFIQCYPHLIEKKTENRGGKDVEIWIFKFSVPSEK